ncbi:sulfate transporter family-domain-containing protein [Polychytrium aggregatum]|uniref:sulfate transporter family-domain-containing protein n=1 Tax=Polychytrium aggregatum TaxID=110093 RepID=UPI0022FE7330|nr:sulfate transporter family-domain-containing protein [Polychytrium aggregatum]KAI9199863.1 sulfate transporter family-domain-containing protein [Polychytrium aggregatum]
MKSHEVIAPPGYSPSIFDSQYTILRSQLAQGTRQLPVRAQRYLLDLFPVRTWLLRYNWSWLSGDLIAAITVTGVIIPQALAYATLAGLPVQYGLYTGIAGLLFYFLFATSKDVTIGATAVLSQLVGQVLVAYNPDQKYDPVSLALLIAFCQGLIELCLGLFRLGIIVDLLPSSVISGFTTGAGVTVIIAQLPGLLGITGVDTNDPSSAKILVNTFKSFHGLNYDSLFGLTALVFLFAIKYGCRYMVKRGWTSMRWLGICRNLICLVIFTGASYAAYKDVPGGKYPISIVKTVPYGLQGFVVPTLNDSGMFLCALRASVTVVIVAVIEHIAVAKSYGRVNNYKVNPNQELVALGFVNILGSFIGGFPATGSFSRTAINSASGVRTPLAGLLTAGLVVISIFTITPAFFWIPKASLSAVIVAAIADLFAPVDTIKQLWDIHLSDFFSFLVALLVTIIFNIESGIEVSIAFALAILVYRIARPNIQPLVQCGGKWYSPDQSIGWEVSQPPPGVLVFRPEESLTYPNSAFITEKMLEGVKEKTRYGAKVSTKSSTRIWSDTTGLASSQSTDSLPIVRHLVIDMSSVNFVDATGVQALADLRRDLDNYAGRPVEIHFSRVKPSIARPIFYFLHITNCKKPIAAVGTHSLEAEPEPTQPEQINSCLRFFHASVQHAISAIAGAEEILQCVVSE